MPKSIGIATEFLLGNLDQAIEAFPVRSTSTASDKELGTERGPSAQRSGRWNWRDSSHVYSALQYDCDE
jgi:hypothetical protein